MGWFCCILLYFSWGWVTFNVCCLGGISRGRLGVALLRFGVRVRLWFTSLSSWRHGTRVALFTIVFFDGTYFVSAFPSIACAASCRLSAYLMRILVS